MGTKNEKGCYPMLHLLLGRDWTANRDEILRRIAADVKARQGGLIWILFSATPWFLRLIQLLRLGRS